LTLEIGARVLVAALVLSTAITACGGSAGPSSECERAIADAAAVDATQDTVEDLDDAIRACPSIAEFEGFADDYPDALDGVSARTFVGNRCQFEPSLTDTDICQELGIVPSAPSAAAQIPAQEYIDYFTQRSALLRATLEDMAGDVAAGDWFALSASAAQLDLLSRQEVEWLDAHPADACYADVHAASREAYVLMQQAGAVIAERAEADDPAAATTGDDLLAAAGARLDVATSGVPGIPAACGL
jgi:hypothetical protein